MCKIMFKRFVFCDIIQDMKSKIFIFASLLAVCGTANASECIGAGCDIEPTHQSVVASDVVTTTQYAPVVPAVPQYTAPVEYMYGAPIPMRQVKLLSVKSVEPDDRAPLWDGTTGKYSSRGYDKTVDWRDGVPIWDDSIVSYKDKDFSDWYLQPTDELYIREIDETEVQRFPSMPPHANMMPAPVPVVPAAQPVPCDTSQIDIVELYNQNMADAATTRARVEELLNPQRPSDDLWMTPSMHVQNNFNGVSLPAMRPEYVAQDLTVVVNETFGRTDGCPFETETECNIWLRKPIVRETVSPRSPKIRTEKMDEFIGAARCNKKINASDPTAAPLLARYKMLMASANACCSDGMAYALKRAGATDGLVYKFMSDDANFYGFGSRCLMMTDEELDAKYPNTATAAVAADVRNGCLCRGRQWFNAMLAPFNDVYSALPGFRNEKFYYTYTDGLQREVTVSINNDVQNVMRQLSQCP